MKKALIFVAVGLIAMQSCKEIGPQVDFGPGVAKGEDTTYSATIETPQTKVVLAEEFTGVSCPPCPNGHTHMKSIKQAINGNLITVAYHVFNVPQANPVHDKDGAELTEEDLRTQDATDVGSNLFGGVRNLPVAVFDRAPVNGEVQLDLTQWSEPAEKRAALSTPVNIHLSSSYDDASKQAKTTVKLAYTANVDMSQAINVMVIQDSIIDAQKTPSDIIKDYVHEHALRKIITPITGAIIPDKVNPKEAGKVYEREFTIDVDPKWEVEHCHIVAFVTNDDPDDRTVVQAAEIKLTGE